MATRSLLLILVLLLLCSLTLNVLFIFKRVRFFDGDELSWSRRAAKEAERAAAISCSGHGRAFIDSSLVVHGEQQEQEQEQEGVVCVCNSCYGGSHYQNFIPSCPANAKSGDPLFLEPFWMENAASSAIMVAGWHRMSYTFNHSGYMSKQLEARIRQIHAFVGNAVTEGKYIIFGVGSTQLVNAAVHALSSHHDSSSSLVVPSIPYYELYRQQTEFFQEVDYKFEGDVSLWMNNYSSDSASNLIEIVTSPNNPDGQLNHARLHYPNAKAIYDRVYYWPHFTAISAPADDDIMLFSLSKLTGHAGTRFGWAVVKDETVFTRMSTYLTLNTVGVSHESQLRALHLMKVIIQEKGKNGTMFDFGYKTMRNRWEKLNEIISLSKRFSLQKLESQYCNFFHKIRQPSPAFAWLKCLREEEKDCHAVLTSANIMGFRGSTYGAEDRFVRLSLIRTQDDFDHLLHQLKILISEEDSAKSI